MGNWEDRNAGEAPGSTPTAGKVLARGARSYSCLKRNRLSNASSRRLTLAKGFAGQFHAVELLLGSLSQSTHELCVPGGGPERVGSVEAAIKFIERHEEHCHLLIGNRGPGGLTGFVIKVDQGHDREDGAFGDAPSIIVRSREHVWYTHLITHSVRNEKIISILRERYRSAPIHITDRMPLPYGDVNLDQQNGDCSQRFGVQHSECAARFLSLLITMW